MIQVAATDATLSLRDAADELGVHYMTAYRYVRLGMLPAAKIGASWHVLVEDLQAFREESSKPAPKRSADWDRRFADRLIAGDAAGAWSVVEAALASGMDVTGVYVKVLTPALKLIGERWEEGTLDVATEHRASGIAHRILGRLGHRLVKRGRSRGTVVIGTPEGELHSLPVAMLADLLRSAGWDVMDLGCNLPAASFVHAAGQADRLTALGVSLTTPSMKPAARATIEVLREAFPDTPILLGGQAIADEEEALRLGADAWASDGVAAITILDNVGS